MFKRISEDHEHAAHGTAIPGFGRTIWKYRCKSSDLQRGTQGGFRIIAYYDQGTGTRYPILLYPKTEREDISPLEIEGAVVNLKESLRQLLDDTARTTPEKKASRQNLGP